MILVSPFPGIVKLNNWYGNIIDQAINILEKQYFFKKYNIDAQSFADAGLDWNMLQDHLAAQEKQFSEKIQSSETAIQSITQKLSSLKNQAPSMDGAVDISDDFTGRIDLTAEEIAAVSQILEKVQGVKRINIDTDDDGTPDTFIIEDAVKGRLLAVDKDQDGKVDYYIKL